MLAQKESLLEAGSGDGQLTLHSDGTMVQAGQYALAHSGAEALARRHFRGLDIRLGEHAPSLVQEGLSGIASGFVSEPGTGLSTGPDTRT